MTIVPIQTSFDKQIPDNIRGNSEYFLELELLQNMDYLLKESGAEVMVMEAWFKDAKNIKQSKGESTKLSCKVKISIQERATFALRAAILRKHLDLSYRQFAKVLALAPLYQWFCNMSSWKKIKIPGKTILNDLEQALPENLVTEIVNKLTTFSISESGREGLLHTKDKIDISECFFDTFCLKTNIHYPTDWILLRDASRTLMLGVMKIRKENICNRMANDCQSFVTDMNKLCIEMTHSARREGGRKLRKKCFRKMKKLVKRISKHAKIHLQKLNKEWMNTDLSEKQMLQIAKRIENILEQLPEAIRQGHERIIGDRPIKSTDKILSLYENDVNVIVRHKASAMVEYGNKVSLLEQKDGLIIDWDLSKDGAPVDTKLCIASYDRTKEKLGVIGALSADRGCNSAKNSKHLKDNNTYDATCPRSVDELSLRMNEEQFRELQKRRASTEARIAILGNFTGEKLKCKSYTHRRQQFSLCVLTHNLWKLSKLIIIGKQYWSEIEAKKKTG